MISSLTFLWLRISSANPPALNPGGQWDSPAAVAAAALEAHILSGVELPVEARRLLLKPSYAWEPAKLTSSVRVRGVGLRPGRRPQRSTRTSAASVAHRGRFACRHRWRGRVRDILAHRSSRGQHRPIGTQ